MADKLNKKVYKQLKREVVESSAIQVGYFETIMQAIPNYAMIEAVRHLSEYGWITPNKKDIDVQNMLVTEAIKVMNYQDFKDVAPHLFSFNPYRQQSDIPIVETVNITQVNYEAMQSQIVSLLSFQEAVLNQQNSVSSKIESLEMTKVETGEKVIGVNTDTEELILLRTPENAYIDDSEVIQDGLLVDYRNSLAYTSQITQGLVERYDEIKTIAYEYTFDNANEPTHQFKDIFSQVTGEKANYLTDDLNSREFYSMASTYPAFKQAYQSYDSFIDDAYNRAFYGSPIAYRTKGEYFLEEKAEAIQDILDKYNQELLLKRVVGYSQGERWTLGYIRDKAIETREQAEYYLEHKVGAWYKGSLTEFSVISFNEITPEGYTGNYESRYLVDEEVLWFANKLDKIKALYPEFKDFEAPEEKEQNKVKEMDKGGKSL